MSDMELRISDPDREQAVARLRLASSEGRLTLEELADRTTLAYTSTTRGELERVTADLPTASPAPVGQAKKRLACVFSGLNRRGRWRVPGELRLICVFGGANLDFRAAEFVSSDVRVRVTCVFGGVTVRVPQGVAIENDIVPIFGGSNEHGDPGTLVPESPRIQFTGASIFGGFDLKYDAHS
jgi:hypothetical protein